MNNNEIIFFAETTFRNIRRKFGIKSDDRRRHVYAVGKTGMGKTVMMENMAIQDIQHGRGIGFIDPHGEAAERLLDFVPSGRINDVIYIDPSDLEHPLAFNIMENVDVKHRHLVASGLMGVFKKIWPDVWSARMEYILNNSILALLECPGSTLLGINRMLVDVDYRKKIVDKITDPVVKAFWVKEYARYTQRYEVEATAAIQNKVGQLISSPLIRNIVGQVKSSINIRKVMDEQKIIIMNLSKGKIGEDNSRLLGALLITKLQLASMSRVDIPEQERKDFFLYVDEFQNFATKSFINILSEARKYRLALILGHQYIMQMEEDGVKEAVFGNVGTVISFRVGAEDAEYLEKEFVPDFTAADLVNLAKYNIYLKLMIDGVAGRPFSAKTFAPWPLPEKSNKENIIKISRERYSMAREEIESKITRWLGVLTLPEAIQSDSFVLYDARCSLCGKDTKVTFRPDGVRPVYCKPCRKKLEQEREESKTVETSGNRKTPPPQVAPPYETAEPARRTISLEEASKRESISFLPPRKLKQEKPKRKEVNIGELKKALEESFDSVKQSEEELKNKRSGVIRPGETVKF